MLVCEKRRKKLRIVKVPKKIAGVTGKRYNHTSQTVLETKMSTVCIKTVA